MDKSNFKKKIHLLPNVITAFGLTCGLFVIFKINMTPIAEMDYFTLLQTTGILLLAAFADLLDGAVARAMKAESEFGGLFDSLADAISFGVAPAIVVLKTLSIPPGTESSFLMTTSAMVYTLCGVLRLVRFNILSQKAKVDIQQTEDHKKNFTGLPIPAAAGAAVSMNLFLFSPAFQNWAQFSYKTNMTLLFLSLLFLGYLMVSRWKFFSVKTLQVRVASFRLIFITVVFAVVLFYGLLHNFPLVFFIISWAYVLIAWFLSIFRVIVGRRVKTLEDFEPESDDELDIE